MTTISVSRDELNNAIDVAGAWLRHDEVLITPQTLFDHLMKVYCIERGSSVPYVQQLAAAKFLAMMSISKNNPDVIGREKLLNLM